MTILYVHSTTTVAPVKEIEIDACTTFLDVRYQLFSLTDIPPERILLHFSGHVRSPSDAADETATLSAAGISSSTRVCYSDSANSSQTRNANPSDGTISLADVKKALQQCGTQSVSHVPSSHGPTNGFLSKVRRYYSAILTYEDKDLQKKALAVVPLETLQGQAREKQETDKAYPTYEHALAKELLHWFKNSFFTWIDTPKCWSCGEKTSFTAEMSPSETEKRFKASRTEEYACSGCGAETRFPRYNDVAKLLETRRGRCGEWAQAFTLIARAAGLRVRAVHDWTDHVWTEVWCGRWVHADACEDVLDEPVLYEKGWKKKLNYCIATGVDCVADVTRRYTRNFEALQERRTLADEGLLQAGLRALNDQALAKLAQVDRLEALKRNEQDAMELLRGSDARAEELPARQSGSANWVKSRGEDGSDK